VQEIFPKPHPAADALRRNSRYRRTFPATERDWSPVAAVSIMKVLDFPEAVCHMRNRCAPGRRALRKNSQIAGPHLRSRDQFVRTR